MYWNLNGHIFTAVLQIFSRPDFIQMTRHDDFLKSPDHGEFIYRSFKLSFY